MLTTDDPDLGRTDELGNREFIIQTTGGPKKYYRYRRRKNPLFQKLKLAANRKIEVEWYLDFVRSLRQIRHSTPLTQKQLAKFIGSNQAAVSRFEHGQANPSLAFLINYAQKLGWDVKLTLEERVKDLDEVDKAKG